MRKSFAFFLLIVGAYGLAAETPATYVPEAFIESIDVRVINVDVYVTDRQGRPVTGLGRADFALFDDGKEVELTNFEAIDNGTLPPRISTPNVSPEPAATAEVLNPKPLNLVIFVDNFNLRPQTRNRVLKQLDEFLEKSIRAQDRVMIVTHDLGLQIRKPLAIQTASLNKDLHGLTRLATRGPLTDSFTRQTLERIQHYGCTTEASVEARSYAQQAFNDTVSTLSALRRMIESLAGIEGRKAVLYVSDGLPLRPGEDVFAYLAKTCGEASGNPFDVDDVANELRKVTTAANANGVTLYTLEGAGLKGFTSVSVESTNSFQTPTMDFVQNANVQDTLFNLASETGGLAALNSNDLRLHLDHIARDLRTYYSLGYSARTSADGRIHDLHVKVNRPGLKVRCRKTYRDSTPEHQMLAKLEAALWHGIEENPLEVKVHFRKAEPEGRGQFLLPVQIQVPLSKLTLLPNGDTFSGRFSILVISRDPEGRSAQPQRVEVPVTRTAGEMLSGLPVPKSLNLVLRKGGSVLALGIKDEIGGGTTFLQELVSPEGTGKIPSPDTPATAAAVVSSASRRVRAPSPASKPK